MRRASGVHELFGDRDGDVDRDRERDAFGADLGARGDRGVDADDRAGRVDSAPPELPCVTAASVWIMSNSGDCVRTIDATSERRDDAGGHALLESER